VLKRSGAVPAEIIAGRRRIKPSRKAKHAAGINSSDEESNGDPQDEPANTGLKHKASKKASSASNKQKPNEAPKAKQARKRARVNSEDAESSDEDAGHTEDQADAYEWLRLERETDRPVCGEINYLLVIANKPFQVKKKRSSRGNDSRTTDVRTVFTPDERTMSDNTIEKGNWCEVCK